MLVDDFGREVSGVRISLTDRCNFDCVYCHNEGLGDTRGPMEPSDDEMSTDDVVRFLEVVEEFGVEKVKFTGGEPMLRQDLAEIVRRAPDEMEVSMTTNGTFLPGRAPDLVDAGLERVNVSQDALDSEAFAELTQSGAYDRVLEGVEAALDAGLDPVNSTWSSSNRPRGTSRRWSITSPRTPVCSSNLSSTCRNWRAVRTGTSTSNASTTGSKNAPTRSNTARCTTASATGCTAARRRSKVIVPPPRWPRPTAGYERRRSTSATGDGRNRRPRRNEDFCANCHRVRLTHEGYLKGCLNRNDDLRTSARPKSRCAPRSARRSNSRPLLRRVHD